MGNKSVKNIETTTDGLAVIDDREYIPRQKARKISTKPVTFHIQLTAEQKLAKASILNNVVTFLKGKPGTAKSTLACNAALDRLIKGHVSQIIITRPHVNVGKEIGHLPGGAFSVHDGKSAPFVTPMLDAMYKLRNKEEIDQMIEKEKIVVLPTQFVRGRNFEDCFVIVDESQNLNVEEFKALTTRICNDAYMVFTSDINQIDLYHKQSSSGYFVDSISDLEGVAVVELTENFRHPLALAIMERVDERLIEKEKLKEKEKEAL